MKGEAMAKVYLQWRGCVVLLAALETRPGWSETPGYRESLSPSHLRSSHLKEDENLHITDPTEEEKRFRCVSGFIHTFPVEDESSAAASQCLVCRRGDDVTVLKGGGDDSGCHQAADVSHVPHQVRSVLICYLLHAGIVDVSGVTACSWGGGGEDPGLTLQHHNCSVSQQIFHWVCMCVCESVWWRTCDDDLGVKQPSIFLQSVVIDVSGFWIDLKAEVQSSLLEMKHQSRAQTRCCLTNINCLVLLTFHFTIVVIINLCCCVRGSLFLLLLSLSSSLSCSNRLVWPSERHQWSFSSPSLSPSLCLSWLLLLFSYLSAVTRSHRPESCAHSWTNKSNLVSPSSGGIHGKASSINSKCFREKLKAWVKNVSLFIMVLFGGHFNEKKRIKWRLIIINIFWVYSTVTAGGVTPLAFTNTEDMLLWFNKLRFLWFLSFRNCLGLFKSSFLCCLFRTL